MLGEGQPAANHPDVDAAYAARDRLLGIDRQWEADLDKAELRAAHKRARAELRAANAKARGKPVVCPRCGGEKRIPAYRHVEGGICFHCSGAGTVPFVRASARLAPDQRAKKAAKRAAEDQAARERARAARDEWVLANPLAAAAVLRATMPADEAVWREFTELAGEEAVVRAATLLHDHHRDLRYPTIRVIHRALCEVCEQPLDRHETARWDSFTNRGDRDRAPLMHDRCAPSQLPADPSPAWARAYIEQDLGPDWSDDLYRAFGIEVAPA